MNILTKSVLVALLIPTLTVPMRPWLKPTWKKAATLAGVATLGYLGYKAFQKWRSGANAQNQNLQVVTLGTYILPSNVTNPEAGSYHYDLGQNQMLSHDPARPALAAPGALDHKDPKADSADLQPALDALDKILSSPAPQPTQSLNDSAVHIPEEVPAPVVSLSDYNYAQATYDNAAGVYHPGVSAPFNGPAHDEAAGMPDAQNLPQDPKGKERLPDVERPDYSEVANAPALPDIAGIAQLGHAPVPVSPSPDEGVIEAPNVPEQPVLVLRRNKSKAQDMPVVRRVEVPDWKNGFNWIFTKMDKPKGSMNEAYAGLCIEKGAKVMEDVLAGKTRKYMSDDLVYSHLHAIRDLAWFLYGKALEKNQGFEEGTFVIVDEDFKLYDFLMTYVKSKNETVTGISTQDPLLHMSDNPFAYSRDCSHFPLAKQKFTPYGIDIRFAENAAAEDSLPAFKTHILFGKIDEERHLMYIKPENHGLYKGDGFMGHATEFGVAQVRKIPTLRNAFNYVGGYWGYNLVSDDSETFRKDRVPEGFATAFKQAITTDSSLYSQEEKAQLLKDAKEQGFKTLYSELAQRSPTLQGLLEKYSKIYDHMEYRQGREIILKTAEFGK